MLIWVASYPRSGNRLLRIALSTGWGIEGPSVFDAAERARAEGRRRLPDPERDPQIEAFREAGGNKFLKTHLLAHADTPDPAVFLVRDGRDSVLSYAHFMADRPALARGRGFEELLIRLIERPGGQFGSWSESFRAWSRRDAPTAVVRFEDLREDPQGVARAKVAELGIELGPPRGEMWSFERMRQEDPSVVRRGQVGDWRREMPMAAIERFAEIHGETLVELGYERSADPSRWRMEPEGTEAPVAGRAAPRSGDAGP